MQNRMEENVGINDTASSSVSKSAKGQRSEPSTRKYRNALHSADMTTDLLAVTSVTNT